MENVFEANAFVHTAVFCTSATAGSIAHGACGGIAIIFLVEIGADAAFPCHRAGSSLGTISSFVSGQRREKITTPLLKYFFQWFAVSGETPAFHLKASSEQSRGTIEKGVSTVII